MWDRRCSHDRTQPYLRCCARVRISILSLGGSSRSLIRRFGLASRQHRPLLTTACKVQKIFFGFSSSLCAFRSSRRRRILLLPSSFLLSIGNPNPPPISLP